MLMQVGQTVEASGMRFHRFAYTFRCEELANAGKRGKKVRRFDVNMGNITNKAMDEILDVSYRVSDETTYDGALSVAKCFIDTFLYTLSVDESTERGIDVEPSAGSDTSEVTVSNDSMFVECSLRSFRVCDRADLANESTLIDVRKSDPAKLLKWLRANTDSARTMTFRQMWDTMNGLGIRAHYYCAVD